MSKNPRFQSVEQARIVGSVRFCAVFLTGMLFFLLSVIIFRFSHWGTIPFTAAAGVILFFLVISAGARFSIELGKQLAQGDFSAGNSSGSVPKRQKRFFGLHLLTAFGSTAAAIFTAVPFVMTGAWFSAFVLVLSAFAGEYALIQTSYPLARQSALRFSSRFFPSIKTVKRETAAPPPRTEPTQSQDEPVSVPIPVITNSTLTNSEKATLDPGNELPDNQPPDTAEFPLSLRTTVRFETEEPQIQPQKQETVSFVPGLFSEPETIRLDEGTDMEEPLDGMDEPEEIDEMEEPEPDENSLFMENRFKIDGGRERIEGWFRPRFEPQQEIQVVHLTFCPPFENPPTLELIQLAGEEVSFGNSQIEPFGARVEIKRHLYRANSESVVSGSFPDLSVRIGFFVEGDAVKG